MMKKGSVTIFCALSLSSFILLVTTLTFLCISNYERVRTEISTDISANSVLGEYSKAMFEEFDLLYIDASYLNKEPSIENVNSRLNFYHVKNTSEAFEYNDSPWGSIQVSKALVNDYQAATADNGKALRAQAALYARDCDSLSELKDEVSEAMSNTMLAGELDGMEDPMIEWSILMSSLESMPLPKVGNIEYELLNPANWVYEMAEGDILYNGEVDTLSVSDIHLDNSRLISNREVENTDSMHEIDEGAKEEYLTYIMDRFGYFKHSVKDRLYGCEIEYAISGQTSDLANFRAVTDRIYRWRFNDNLALARNDGGLRAEAYEAAASLKVCELSPEFIEPVCESIIYACAYLETVSDIHGIFTGGRVPVKKLSHGMSVAYVIAHHKYFSQLSEGLYYRQYLICMLDMLSYEELNYKIMDLIEMQIRKMTSNDYFKMDWCIDCISVSFAQSGRYLNEYTLSRIYGIY